MNCFSTLRVLFFLIVCVISANVCFAQLSKGGIPLGLQNGMDNQPAFVHTYDRPSFEDVVRKREKEELGKGISSPYLVALGVPVNISFPESGTFTTTADTHLIWRTSIQVDGINGLGFSYDKFQLPPGVNYFIINDNKNQVLGAFTYSNVTDSKVFAHEPVQGDIAHIELDINPNVSLENIHLHINNAVAYFRGVEYLKSYKNTASKPTDEYWDSSTLNVTSVCMIDANCPVASNYYNQKRATLSILLPDTVTGGYVFCSAVMVNTVGNVPNSCKNYVLTASHCDQANSTSKNFFDLMLLRYNYEQAICNSDDMVISNTLVGCDFIARNNYVDSINYVVKEDFLLLKTKEQIPESWNVVLSGWNRDTNFAYTVVKPREFVTFTHPDGDTKKFAASHTLTSGPWDTSVTENTHWLTMFDTGSVSAGSSGGGLFDVDGYLIGTMTGGKMPQYIDMCSALRNGDTLVGNYPLIKQGAYSKLSYNWTNNDTLIHKLQPWLDPANTSVMKIEGQKSTCAALDSVYIPTAIGDVSFSQSINIFPNPAVNNNVNIQFNFSDYIDVKMMLVDINGRKLRSYNISKVKTGIYNIDLKGLTKGMYMLCISNGSTVINKKLVL